MFRAKSGKSERKVFNAVSLPQVFASSVNQGSESNITGIPLINAYSPCYEQREHITSVTD